MSKKKVYGFVELSSKADFDVVHCQFSDAPVMRVISARHWHSEREHHIEEQIGDAHVYPEETIQKFMETKGWTREQTLRRMSYMNTTGFLVLVTETMIYFVELPNEELEDMTFPKAKEVSWKY